MDSSEKIGKMYMATEITQIVSNELTEIDNYKSVPLLKHVLPNLRVYQLVFFSKIGKRKIYLSIYFITD